MNCIWGRVSRWQKLKRKNTHPPHESENRLRKRQTILDVAYFKGHYGAKMLQFASVASGAGSAITPASLKGTNLTQCEAGFSHNRGCLAVRENARRVLVLRVYMLSETLEIQVGIPIRREQMITWSLMFLLTLWFLFHSPFIGWNFILEHYNIQIHIIHLYTTRPCCKRNVYLGGSESQGSLRGLFFVPEFQSKIFVTQSFYG